ncbi:PfkB family carbohydrate kinase [Persicirhabdus sediminis]|uniref:Carbohydrate kinase n=1 Tax=Persicirhabdus sediminis TaxID=454144 RepID=A0A8J7MBD9_9BACT|nr:PfkB family carbohydrate kinase [Persicirhabdus sediminis]MBK1790322.1 carbohydrate kinase [Persicirhabdus sediminis]
MSIIIGGTIAIDNVITPDAKGEQLLGGSAAYAALSASYMTSSVDLVGIIGRDYPQEHLDMLESHGVTLAGVERSEDESFTWTGEYHENMNERTTHSVGLNVLESWQVKIPAELADADVVVLANMSPDNQIQMLDQCVSANKFVVADTMDLWIAIANERLNEVMQRIDLLVINESEAREFVATSNLIEAGEKLLAKGPKFVIIKLGEFGAYLFGPDGQFFTFPAWPLRQLADPTGAGDSFLGGLAGWLDSLDHNEYSFADIRDGAIRGSVLASFTCEAFSTQKLQGCSSEDINDRLEKLKNISHWE